MSFHERDASLNQKVHLELAGSGLKFRDLHLSRLKLPVVAVLIEDHEVEVSITGPRLNRLVNDWNLASEVAHRALELEVGLSLVEDGSLLFELLLKVFVLLQQLKIDVLKLRGLVC